MDISPHLSALKSIVTTPQFTKEEFLLVVEIILEWLNENNTNEICRRVDAFVSTEISLEERKRLPEEFQSLLYDMGGALHDTHTNPVVARNFQSTPEQLLERVRAMKLNKDFQGSTNVRRLADRIAQSRELYKFDTDEEPAAWNLAYTFSELEASFRKFLNIYLTKLNSDDLKQNEIHEVLLDIGEEFRHILYHLRDAPFYSYIFDA